MQGRGILGRAIGLGASAGLLALALWPFFAFHPLLTWAFVLFAALAGLCGAAILAVTALDLRYHRPRGGRIRAVRTFDLLLATALILLAFLELRDFHGTWLA